MRLLEKLLFAGVLVSTALVFLLIPPGEELTMLFALALAALYYPFGFLLLNQIRLRDAYKKSSYENLTGGKITLSVVVGIALSIVCIGALFKLMSLPGANEMLMIGTIATVSFSVVLAVLLFSKKGVNNKYILVRTVIASVIGGFLFFTSGLTLVKLQYRNHPAYIEAFAKYAADPKNEELWKQKQLEYYRVRLTEEEFKEYEQELNNNEARQIP